MRRKKEKAGKANGDFLRDRVQNVVYPIGGVATGLVPMHRSRDAILVWTFDDGEDGVDPVLIARLDEDEALLIQQNEDRSVGLLEPVRGSLRYTTAFVMGYNGEVTPFEIDRTCSENDFFDRLYAAADDPELYRSSNVEADEAAIVRQLAAPSTFSRSRRALA